MKQVVRPPKPPSLQKNASRWTKELLEELKRDRRSSRVKNLYRRYKKDDVKEALTKMYARCCCYCESSLGAVVFARIEHRQPKSKCPEKMFEWENLHSSCEPCNNAKGEKWNSRAPILDAAVDKIDEHLSYVEIDPLIGPHQKALTDQGQTTINHADLNRDRLVEAREKVSRKAKHILLEAMQIYITGDKFQAKAAYESIRKLTTMQYGSLVAWLLNKYPLPNS